MLGLCNIGLFFPLIFLAAYHLPGGLAATLQATSPLAVMAIAWLVIGERAGVVRVAAALVGLVGVTLLVLRNPGHVDALGLVGAFGSVLVSALGFVLIKRWKAPVDMLTLVSWQLVVGGLALLPVALIVEGAPPAIDAPRRARLPVDRRGRHRAGLRVLVPRAPADVGGRGVDHRAGQPRRGDPARGRVRPRGVRARSRRSAWCWSSAACWSDSGSARGPASGPSYPRRRRRTTPFSSVRPPERGIVRPPEV